MAAKERIIPVRVTEDDSARFRRAAGDEPVSAWLRRVGREAARKQEAAAGVARALDALARTGPRLSDEEAARLASGAIREARARKR